jgi:hypothetical protein
MGGSLKLRRFSMETRKRFDKHNVSIIALTVIITLVMAACGTAPRTPPAEVLEFDNIEISVLQARGSSSGTTDGVHFFSNAKTTLESGTYEILLTRPRSVDARSYEFLVFEISADNLDLLDDFIGFFPRLRTGETYTQFNGSSALTNAVSTISAEGEWATVSVSIALSNAHAFGEDYRVVMPRVDSLLLRFICNDMEPVNGRIFLRNFRFN